MSKCGYCSKDITKGNIRCLSCNHIWNEGVDFGRREVKTTLKEILQHLNNLTDLEK